MVNGDRSRRMGKDWVFISHRCFGMTVKRCLWGEKRIQAGRKIRDLVTDRVEDHPLRSDHFFLDEPSLVIDTLKDLQLNNYWREVLNVAREKL